MSITANVGPAVRQFYIEKFRVQGLWGYKNYRLSLHDDVNVIIGPNASGKTTLINILYDTLTGNLQRLCRTQFSVVKLGLGAFDGGEGIDLELKLESDEVRVKIGNTEYLLPTAPFGTGSEEAVFGDSTYELIRRQLKYSGIPEIQRQLRSLVPAVWLPVSRRLPITEEEESARRRLHRRPLESVDECLSELIENLRQYRLSLNTELSELRKDFQRHALENILFDKQHDQLLLQSDAPSDADKQAMLQAFRDVGFVDKGMESRINAHFAAAAKAFAKYKSQPDMIDVDTLFAIPLISRTRAIVGFAQQLEKEREKLFSPLHTYEKIVNSFLTEKQIDVSDRGDLDILPESSKRGPIDWRHLSSGEKQILILLTQAVLSQKSPVVYVADEPELSLHVTWQEKLLGALTQLAGRCQFIVATHSPDVVSRFGSKVIDLGRLAS